MKVTVEVISMYPQVVNCLISRVDNEKKFFCSFVYGHISVSGRRSLWDSLVSHKNFVNSGPWVILGDFNAILDPSERSDGSIEVTTAIKDFRDCVSQIEVEDLNMSGLKFTWNQSPGNVNGLLEKLDRVMCNMGFIDLFTSATCQFLPFMVSDHSPSMVLIDDAVNRGSRHFRFSNYLVHKPEFMEVVQRH